MPEYPLALLVGVVAGVLSGMFGIGGGIVIVPALTILFAYEPERRRDVPRRADLAAEHLRGGGLLSRRAAGPRRRGGAGDWHRAGLVVRRGLALNLPEATMQRIYGAFLIYVGWRFLNVRKLLAERRGKIAPPRDESGDHTKAPRLPLLVIGIVAGVASGLFGIVGGLVIVPAMVELLHYSQKRAVGTSLAALMPPVSIGAVISYYNAGAVSLAGSTLIALGLIAGAFFGARIALSLPSSTVRRLYGLFLLVVAARFILQL